MDKGNPSILTFQLPWNQTIGVGVKVGVGVGGGVKTGSGLISVVKDAYCAHNQQSGPPSGFLTNTHWLFDKRPNTVVFSPTSSAPK
jgi:hypothetical protein